MALCCPDGLLVIGVHRRGDCNSVSDMGVVLLGLLVDFSELSANNTTPALIEQPVQCPRREQHNAMLEQPLQCPRRERHNAMIEQLVQCPRAGTTQRHD